MPMSDDPEGLVAHLTGCERVVSFPYQVPKRGSAAFPLTVARSWLSRDPVDLWKWRMPAVRECANGLVDAGRVDVCVADFLFAFANVPLDRGVPTVLFEHNVEYLIWKRLRDLETVAWRRALLDIEWRKLRASEAAACRACDVTIAVSEDDRDRLLALAPAAQIDVDPDGRRHQLLHHHGPWRTARARGVQRLDGLASERGRGSLLHQRHPAARARRGPRRDLQRGW